MKSPLTSNTNARFGSRFGWLVFALTLLASGSLSASTTTFTFTLDEPCKTSAGVYLADGTLVRTLWSKVFYYATGTFSSNWDGLDDSGNAVAPGNYEIRLLENNVEYVWDGAIGNTSAEMSGPTVHRGFYAMQDLAISGTNAFYCSGYNEAQYGFRSFLTTDPQHVKSQWFWDINQFGALVSAPGWANRNWLWTTADSNQVYFACDATLNPTNSANYGYPGCIVASKVNDNSPAVFASGLVITNASGDSFPSGIYVGTQPGLSGLSVQQNGNLLAAAVAPDNRVYLMDKLSGAALTSFAVNSPGRLNFSPDGSLWVCSSNTVVIAYTNLTVNPKAAVQITGLSEPLDVAVNPTNADLILVADGGSSQQVKAFDTNGTPLWTYGLAGGYQANGPAVTTNKFWFSYNGVHQTFITFAADGSFWVGDEENHRVLHFSASRGYLEQIMYQPHAYTTSVDQNNPSRVFNEFLEFNVDYTKPLLQSWTLVNNWMASADTNHISGERGLTHVTTFANGRTYALINNRTNSSTFMKELCELTTNGLRFTGIYPMANNLGTARWNSLGADGSARAATVNAAAWYESTLSGFDASNNPVWNPETLIASASANTDDPCPRCCAATVLSTTITSNNILISFDSTLNNGWHLGGIKAGATNWLWKASPAGDLNGLGNYEIDNGLTYAGSDVQSLDCQVVYGYHGEFFRHQGQAGQHMHFYDDGLFIGQFGENSLGHPASEGSIPGFAGNGQGPTLTKSTNGACYAWENDESAHGPQRWQLVNANNIREQTGTGILGGTINLTNPAAAFPTGVTSQPGNQGVDLKWLPVPHATTYKIYSSVINGGPYLTLAGQTPSTNYGVMGLTNGRTYYFVVTALIGGAEGPPSEQASARPFDTSQTVLATGSLSEGGLQEPVIDVDSNAPANGYPAYLGNEHYAGRLSLDDLCNYGFGNLMNVNVGAKGYALFDWSGPGSNLVQIPSPFTITVGSGWNDSNNLKRQYRVNGALGAVCGLTANPLGTINIGVSDSNFHFLTMVSPAISSGHRGFTVTLASTNGTSASFNVNENPGWSHTFQFLFRGNVTLSVNDFTNAANATVQALFLDDLAAGTTLSPPTGLKIIPDSK